jgi:hypothetical protein
VLPLLTVYCPLIVYLSSTFQRAAEDGFAADFGSVSGDGHSFRYCTVGELLRGCDFVSVRAVLEKRDEKGLGAVSGRRNVRCRQFGRAPLRLSPSASLGASAKQGRLSRKARAGAHPRLFRVNTRRQPGYAFPGLTWPTRHKLGVELIDFKERRSEPLSQGYSAWLGF